MGGVSICSCFIPELAIISWWNVSKGYKYMYHDINYIEGQVLDFIACE